MGIDVHGLNFLRLAHKRQGDFGKTATLGRQEVHIPRKKLARITGSGTLSDYTGYCEPLLEHEFGASLVESYDASSYENATYVRDLNSPFDPPALYDTVIDAGTLEHVFNISTALSNVAGMCRVGGQIIHILPGNNFSGHGFWQFSPELFFSLYSADNGFSDTEVYAAELRDEQHWFQAEAPKNGKRIVLTSRGPMYVLCRTVRQGVPADTRVQQSDYVELWDSNAPGDMDGVRTRKAKPFVGLRRFVRENGFLDRHVRQHLADRLHRRRYDAHRNNALHKRAVDSLLR